MLAILLIVRCVAQTSEAPVDTIPLHRAISNFRVTFTPAIYVFEVFEPDNISVELVPQPSKGHIGPQQTRLSPSSLTRLVELMPQTTQGCIGRATLPHPSGILASMADISSAQAGTHVISWLWSVTLVS